MGHFQCLGAHQWAWAPPFLISKLKFSYDKYSVDKVWTKIYCHFYFRGITLIKITPELVCTLYELEWLFLLCTVQKHKASLSNDYRPQSLIPFTTGVSKTQTLKTQTSDHRPRKRRPRKHRPRKRIPRKHGPCKQRPRKHRRVTNTLKTISLCSRTYYGRNEIPQFVFFFPLVICC